VIGLIVRLVIACVIAAAVALILSQLVGPLLAHSGAPFITDVGKFLEGVISWIIGFLAGAFWFMGPGKGFTIGSAA
jgi:hypothetical protein